MSPARIAVPVVLAAALAALLGGAGARASLPAQAPDPRAAKACEGLDTCIPVIGPWVIVPAPAPGSPSAVVQWQMVCPEGLVGGLNAVLADRWIALSFAGRLGSPVNPGITTADTVVFTALAAGPVRRSTSFQPLVGCIPAQGQQRTPTGRAAPDPFKPGMPIVRRVRSITLPAGHRARVTHSCKAGERLLSSSTAVALGTAKPPNAAQRRAVRVTRRVRAGKIHVTATRSGLPRSVGAEIQIHAVCAGATRP